MKDLYFIGEEVEGFWQIFKRDEEGEECSELVATACTISLAEKIIESLQPKKDRTGLKFDWIGNFNPFEFITCPTCGKAEFTSLSAGSVWCDYCNTNFSVRHTAGDPGCVVDADTTDAYGPSFICDTCSFEKPSLDERVECPKCKVLMSHKEGYSAPLMERPPRKWYMILKTGDYASGWLRSGIEHKDMYEHPSCRDKDLERRWIEFQQRADFRIGKDKLPGGVRWQMISKGAAGK